MYFTACEDGTFGVECAQSCNCAANTVCDPVAGCNSCNQGWTGAGCDIDIDECVQNNFDCPDDHACNNIDGSYECICPPGTSVSDENCIGGYKHLQ